jgi:hypothetical protein
MPKDTEKICGFLGLTGYYKNLCKVMVELSAPLTSLLKKNAFVWNDATEQAFHALKEAMCTTPILVC